MYFVSSTEKSYGFIRQNGDQLLHISKPDGEIHVEPGSRNASNAGLRKVDGILGIVRLRMAKYIVVITKSHAVGRIQNHDIFQADSFDLLPLRSWRVKDETEQEYLELISQHLQNGNIFFSHTWDLTNCFQRQKPFNMGEMWKQVDTRFFWNHFVSQDLMNAAVHIDPAVGDFILPCVYGVVSLHETTINNVPVSFGIITRRSRFRAGTRYFRRGIDEDGKVANYNETEQILVTGAKVYSFVQTRGSVPVFWGEINNLRYRPMLRIGDTPVQAAKKHFDEQVDIYGKNYLVNLVNQSGYEKPVKQSYENVVQNLGNDQLDYVYFDFHHECSKMRWHRVDVLIEELERHGIDYQGWFQAAVDSQGAPHVEARQQSVVRTNCMDCLDRTNVVQSQLARWVLQRQLETEGIVPRGHQWENLDASFLFIFRNTWADNADGVSCAYSGTGALKTDFTRLGKRTKMGALQDLRNSIVRYFRNNFYDGPRQDGFDLFLGNHLPFEAIEPPFTDARPLLVQCVPYVMLASVCMITAATFFPKEDAPPWVNKSFILFWILTLAASGKSMLNNGLQYVSWPRLNSLDYIRETEDLDNKGYFKGWIWSEIADAATRNHLNPGARTLEEGKLD